MNDVVTRFPPSPTGYLHIGGLRTALYNYLFARKNGGEMVLRIEDTDRTRYVSGAVESLIDTLARVGLSYDRGPFLQSDRLELYKSHAEQLLRQGNAYYCFCSKDRLESVRKQQELAKMQPKYDRHCANLSPDDVEQKLSANEPFVIRMRVPEGETTFSDVIRGTVTISHQELDDQVIIKTDGFPTYHLAVVVDDHDMGVTHVIRGEEWLSSTPKHVILYQMFGWELPVFAHLPLILNPDKSKLSKRQGDVAVEDYLNNGYLPEALLNFVALLGWNPKGDQELYSMEELERYFDLTKVNKGGAVFNREKLDWMNGQYIRMMDSSELARAVRPFLDAAEVPVSDALLAKACAVEQERLERLTEMVEAIGMYTGQPSYEPLTLVWKKSDEADAREQLKGMRAFLAEIDETDFSSPEQVEASMKGYIETNGLQNGNVLWPARVALSGRAKSPGPFELAWALGKAETLSRLDQAIEKLS